MDIELTIEGRIKTLEENFEDMYYDNVLAWECMNELTAYITSVDQEDLLHKYLTLKEKVKELQSSKSKLLKNEYTIKE